MFFFFFRGVFVNGASYFGLCEAGDCDGERCPGESRRRNGRAAVGTDEGEFYEFLGGVVFFFFSVRVAAGVIGAQIGRMPEMVSDRSGLGWGCLGLR